MNEPQNESHPIKNCSTCAHSYNETKSEDMRQCRVTGFFCNTHRKFLPSHKELCDESFSAWIPIPEKTKPKRRKINWIYLAAAFFGCVTGTFTGWIIGEMIFK